MLLLEEKVNVYYLALFFHDFFGHAKHFLLSLSSFLDNLIVFFVDDFFVALADL